MSIEEKNSRMQKGLIKILSLDECKRANYYLIDSIIGILKGWNEYGENPVNFKYLLAQTIRQYQIPQKHWHLSENASNLWHSITKEEITQYHYRQVVHCTKANGTQQATFYEGAKSVGTIKFISSIDKFPFNNVFIAEHVIPVKEIMSQIIALKNPTNDNVRRLLDSMHICRMLKEEDRRIQNKSDRGTDFEIIVNTIYKDAGITLIKP